MASLQFSVSVLSVLVVFFFKYYNMGNIWKWGNCYNLRIGTAVQILWKGRSDMLDLNKHVCESLMKQVTSSNVTKVTKINTAFFNFSFLSKLKILF